MTKTSHPADGPAASTGAFGSDEPPYPSAARSWGVVILLMLIYVNSFLDRQILSLLVDPIRDSFQISDFWMGLLMGPAFAIFYIVAGIPLGRLADLMSRRWLILVGQAVWSVMSVGCGLARSFPQMLGLRIGVGVGEATLSPAAYSMITDLFPRHKLARALSVYGIGIYVGAGLARVFGGAAIALVGEHGMRTLPLTDREIFPWQVVFFFIAAPTIPLSLALLAVREPVRRGVRLLRDAKGRLKAQIVPLREVWGYLWTNRKTMLLYSLGFSMLSFSSYGAGAWYPSHLIRNFGMSRAQVGLVVGVVIAVGGTVGIYLGGWIADRLDARGLLHSKALTGIISALVWFPAGLLYPTVPSAALSVFFYFFAALFSAMSSGVGPAGIQQMMPNTMRGQASSIYLFIVNLFGLGFGPMILGAFTTYVFGSDSDVRWSLLVVPIGAHLLAALFLFLALKPYLRSLVRLQQWQQAAATQR